MGTETSIDGAGKQQLGPCLDAGNQVFLLPSRWRNAIEDLSQAAVTAVQIRAISKLLFSLCCDTSTKISLLLAPEWRGWSLKTKGSVTVGKGGCVFEARYGGSYSSLLYFYSHYYFLGCLTAHRCYSGPIQPSANKMLFSLPVTARFSGKDKCPPMRVDSIQHIINTTWI